jgi:hypothetical protein
VKHAGIGAAGCVYSVTTTRTPGTGAVLVTIGRFRRCGISQQSSFLTHGPRIQIRRAGRADVDGRMRTTGSGRPDTWADQTRARLPGLRAAAVRAADRGRDGRLEDEAALARVHRAILDCRLQAPTGARDPGGGGRTVARTFLGGRRRHPIGAGALGGRTVRLLPLSADGFPRRSLVPVASKHRGAGFASRKHSHTCNGGGEQWFRDQADFPGPLTRR